MGAIDVVEIIARYFTLFLDLLDYDYTVAT